MRVPGDARPGYSRRAMPANVGSRRSRAMTHCSKRTAGLVLALLAAGCAPAMGQEMEPRAYSPSPVGTTFFLATFARSTGGILTDPSLPVDDVEAEVDSVALGIGHT